ncbi:PP2C family protein-serine/threonine phosphatase [Streptomyces sp. PanSC19]|uniref:PP2C family protein-serine/threonine phosphatase n=1 Tax=Streptomyces sp. PanSC19 TaxID=1520455 RepID=UPI000F4AEBFC|nr:PP2C family protein-serine/threonine phosphatase [Streptomyces sp. PanSC19]
MLALRGLIRSRLLLAVMVGLAALLAVGVAATGFVLNVHHERAARQIETLWHPAVAEVGAVRAAAGDLRAASLAGAGGEELREGARRALEEHVDALGRLAAGSDGEVDAKSAGLDRDVSKWLESARSDAVRDRMRVYGLPASAVGADSAGGTYAAVDARTKELTALLEQRSAREAQDAMGHMNGVMLYILSLAVALLVAAVVAAVVLQRRYLAPAGALARRLRRAASGDASVAGPPPGGGRGWIGRLTEEAEGVRERLAVSQRESLRNREALVQVGPAVQGLREILTSCEDPGPGAVVSGDVRAAEGLIAGDYLGAVRLSDRSTAVFLGDVCGHGVAAGLLAVQLKSVLMVGLRLEADLDSLVRAVHQALADEECFTTLVVAVLDPERSTLTWANAGHEEPFLRRADGTVERLEPTGPLIHPFLPAPPGTWQTRTVQFDPGDLLVLSTDGLTEGRRHDGEEFGEQRASRVLAGLDDPTPSAAVTALYAAAERFSIDQGRDDISLLAAATAAPHGRASGPRTTPPARTGENEAGHD